MFQFLVSSRGIGPLSPNFTQSRKDKSLEIYVDADACPVKDQIVRVAERHGLTVHMVSNSWMRLAEGPLIKRVIVSEGFDAADDWIAERAGAGDIVITADIPLADRCLKVGADVLGPSGKPFTPDNIGTALAMRDLMGHLRDTGEVSGNNPSFTSRDRSQFLQALETAVQRIKHRSVNS
jgi:uncharacterized protein YaiI (UPF0178 family)